MHTLLSRDRAATALTMAAIALSVIATYASATDFARYRIQPSPLLEVDQRRASVVEGVVASWHDALIARYGPHAAEQEKALRTALFALRADALLAVSVSGSFGSIESLLGASDKNTSTGEQRMVAKALGDSATDLVYTPIVPCRIVDTRYGAGGTLAAGDTRNWLAANPGGGFATQGGSGTNCGITLRPGAVLANVVVANTGPGPAFVTAWPSQQTRPTASTLNWTTSGEQIANAIPVALCMNGCSADFSVYVSSSADVIIDVLGYFAAPAGGYVSNIPVNGGFAASDVTNVVGGSTVNAVTKSFGATIAGGGCSGGSQCGTDGENIVNDNFGTVGGGYGNLAGFGVAGTVAGGSQNEAAGGWATVGGGSLNRAIWQNSTVSGGTHNQASGGNATVPGGADNVAAGLGSFAAGTGAKTYSAVNPATSHDGAFAWADFLDFSSALPFYTTGNGEFAVRARGGVRFVTAIDGTGAPTWTCGVSGGAGGSWGCSSDRRLKSGFLAFDGLDALDRLSTLPVYRWFATSDPRKTPHAGPTAQDFMRVFGFGDDETMIGFADAQGVAFAAIQGLNQRLRERDDTIAGQARQIEDLARRLEALERK